MKKFIFILLLLSSMILCANTDLYIEKSNAINEEVERLVDDKQLDTLTFTLALSHDKSIVQALKQNNSELLDLKSLSFILADYTKFKNVWFQIITKDGISLKRSWTDKKGDSLVFRKDIKKFLKTPKLSQSISVGNFDLTFKTMVPIFDKDNSFLGIFETITHFNSIDRELQKQDVQSVMLVDNSYKLKYPFTKKFVRDYYVANQDAPKKMMEYLEKKDIDKFVQTITEQRYYIDYQNNWLITYFSLPDVNNEPMGKFFLFYPLSKLQTIKNTFLTKEERQWIKNNPVVTVGGEMDWAPFDFVNEHGQYDGITKDYLDLITKKTGLKFDVITGYSWNELVISFKNKEFDILPAVYYSKDREKLGDYTTSYYTVRDYLFVKESSDINSVDDLNGKILAIPKGYTVISKIKTQYPNIKILETRSIMDSIASVLSDQADATLEVHAVMSYTIKTNAVEGFKIIAQEGLGNNPLHMLVQKDKKILHSILNKTIIDIPKDEKDKIAQKWLDSLFKEGFINLEQALWILGVFSTILFLLLFKQYIQNKANKIIEKKNRELKSLLSLFDQGDSVLFKWNNDKDWSIDYVSSNVPNLLGYTQDEFMNGKITYAQCIYKDDLERVSEEVETAKKLIETFFRHEPYRIVTKDGDVKWILDYTVIQKDETENITHFIGYIIDITERENSLKNLERFIDTQDNILVLTDGEKLSFANKKFFEFFGFKDIEEFKLKHECICEFFIENDRFFHLGKIDDKDKWIDEILLLPHSERVVSMMGSDFKVYTFSVTINKFDENLLIVSFADISGTILENIKLEEKTIRDKLTNAYNREYFEQNIERFILEYNTDKSFLAIGLLDIDYFKDVNDTFGHDVGDKVLVHFVKTVQKFSRDEDVFVRWGGEEFILVLKVNSEDDLQKALEHLRKVIQMQEFPMVGQKTCSIGGSIYQKGEDIEKTIKRADKAVYDAKESGRNKVVIN